MNLIRPTDERSTSLPVVDAGAAVLLVRHAETDLSNGRLCGRLPGIHLSARGRAEARALCTRLARVPIAAVYSSPLERAAETATAIAEARGLDVVIEREANEVDFGDWTGLSFAALQCREDWLRYNSSRGGASVPGGESPAAARRRIVSAIARLARRHPHEPIVVVTHAELIRYVRLSIDGRSLDEWSAIQIDTASVTPIAAACLAS